MFLIRIAALTLAVALAPAFADERVVVNPDRYAAIAYSPATGAYGYGYDCGTRREAERRALAECDAPDAKLLTWVQFGWAALVVSDDGYYGHATTYGRGANSADARADAIAELRKRSKSPIKLVLIVCSGDVEPIVIERGR